MQLLDVSSGRILETKLNSSRGGNTDKYTNQGLFLAREEKKHQPQLAQATLRKRMNRNCEGFGSPSVHRKNWKGHILGAQRSTSQLVS